MTKYTGLDPRTELEQFITNDLKRALEKRGFQVERFGGAGEPDIIVYDDNIHIIVEATQRVKSQQGGEFESISRHLLDAKNQNSTKKCYVWFVSPETYYGIFNLVRDHNFIKKDEVDMKIIPICFSTFELFITKLIETPKEQYSKQEILTLFDGSIGLVDDESVLRHFFEKLFSEDGELKYNVERREDERHQRVVEELISGFKELENKLREYRIALSTRAIMNVIYLVFIKLYEEKQEAEGHGKNRFTLQGFSDYQENIRDFSNAVHILFENIKGDPEVGGSELFADDDRLAERLSDEFVKEHFIKPFEQYHFYTAKIDGLGAAYEVLGQLSGKDTKVGQFFTPEKVVQFMVKLAELHPSDVVYDPACGTARFLTYSMEDMIEKAKGMRNESDIVDKIRKEQLYGTDDDPTVAKLAKMNMYIHGDGKTNIKDRDGLTFFKIDNNVDVVLTNPPLGDLSYLLPAYDQDFCINRMEVIPRKNKIREKTEEKKKLILELYEEHNNSKNNLKVVKKIEKRIRYHEKEIVEFKTALQRGEGWVTTGTQMKGGGLFLNATKHYLKSIRDSNEKTEWKGGKILIILDEGVLNTDAYKNVRYFIRKNFFIKAIISLTKDTFVPVSSTSTKTSILYAVKKEDTDVIQQEPIFFAYIDKVGLDTRKKVCDNHLFNGGGDIFSKYLEFKNRILDCYDGFMFNKSKFTKLASLEGDISKTGNSYLYTRFIEELDDRLDENYNNPKYDEIPVILQSISKDSILFGDPEIIENITSGKTPKGMKHVDEGIPFLGASNIQEGSIIRENAPKISEKWHNGKLYSSQISKNCFLISMAGTIGKCAIYKYDDTANANQAVAIISLNDTIIIPQFLEKYLNSRIGQLFFGKLQHISSQPNINLGEIKKIIIPKLSKPEQQKIVIDIEKKEAEIRDLEEKIREEKKEAKAYFEKLLLNTVDNPVSD